MPFRGVKMISLLKLVVFIVAIITAIFGHLTHRRNVTIMTLFKLCSIGTNPFVLIEDAQSPLSDGLINCST